MNRIRLAACLLPSLLLATPAFAHGASCATPFQTAGSVLLKPGYSGVVGEFAVPTGYRLQIEYVSAGVRLGTADGRAAFSIATTAGGTSAWHPLPIQAGYTVVDRQTSGEVALYADARSLVKIEVDRGTDTAQETTGRYAVTGCLYPAK